MCSSFFSRIVVYCLVPSSPFLIILLPCFFHVLLFFFISLSSLLFFSQLQKCVVHSAPNSSLDFFMVSPVRTLHLSAATEDDRLQWMSSLSHNIRLSRQHARSTNLLALYHNAKQYTALDQLLRKRLEIIAWLATHCTKSQLSTLAPNLFTIYEFRSLGTACTLTSYCLGIEVESAESLSSMFRSNSLGTKLLDLVLRSERLETSKESESERQSQSR